MSLRPSAAFVLAAALSASAASSASSAELFVNIHSASPMAQGAGLVLAGQALEQKAAVRVLLCDAAGDIALAGREMPALRPRNATPRIIIICARTVTASITWNLWLPWAIRCLSRNEP